MAEKPIKRKHIGTYALGVTIGQGAFGKVKLGTDIFTGEKVAIKILRLKNVKTEKEKNQIEREQNILLKLKHPNIVNLKKVVNDEKVGRSYMIFEYASQGELFDYIVAHGRLSEKDARKFMRQIVSALEYCHALLIIHRDLKPENLLLDDGYNIKISDFGLSNIMEPGKRFTTFCGSLHYACPEILRGEEYVGPGVDIWSIGVILYCLVVGRQPWDAENAEGLISAILDDGLEVPSGLSDACVDLLLQMLRVAESDRIPISKIRTHTWIIEGYGEPPPSYLPPSDPIEAIDVSIIDDLIALNFISNEPEGIAAAKKELLSNERTQLVVVYNLLLQQKQEKVKPPHNEKQLHRTKSESKRKLDIELPEKTSPTKEEVPTLSTSMSISTRKKTKKSIIITTARGERGERGGERSERGVSPQKSRRQKRISKKGLPQSPLAPSLDHVTSNRRQRSVSMSPNNNVRPIIDFESIKQNKVNTPSKPHKKRSQTPQKIRRTVLTEAVFKPPAEGSPEESHSPEIERLPEAEDQAMTLSLPETVSSKPLEQIVEEIVRVLHSQGLNYRKRKHRYIWKCSAQINNETVTLQLEIYKDLSENFGVILRRIQGSFQGYQILYHRIKKEIQL